MYHCRFLDSLKTHEKLLLCFRSDITLSILRYNSTCQHICDLYQCPEFHECSHTVDEKIRCNLASYIFRSEYSPSSKFHLELQGLIPASSPRVPELSRINQFIKFNIIQCTRLNQTLLINRAWTGQNKKEPSILLKI